MAGSKLTGDWKKAERLLAGLAGMSVAIDKATKQEAEYFRSKIIRNIHTRGSWAGKPFKPNVRWTLAKKRGAKPLIDTGELLNSIQVKKSGKGGYFVGIDRTAVSKDGEKIYDIAQLQESGKTIHIVVTHKMLAYLHALARQAAVASARSGRPLSVGSVLIVTIPPRPFIGPVYDKLYGNKNAAKKRMDKRMQKLLKFG